jgi:hypothetical protein
VTPSSPPASLLGRRSAAAVLFAVTVAGVGCGSGQAPPFSAETEVTPPADTIGERLFLDTRFSQYFATHMTSVNAPLPTGDPTVAQVDTANGPLAGPFAGQSINCRSCHFVNEFQGTAGAGNRTYSDYTSHSPMPRSISGFDHTPRNAMQMVDSFATRSGPLALHFDGEFASGEDLVKGTMGHAQLWLASH